MRTEEFPDLNQDEWNAVMHVTGLVLSAFEMSRKGPGSPVTCRDGLLCSGDLRTYPFGCFTLMPIDTGGSP
ncbi:hypothetical protein YWIDRAFT_03686 [Streptomyces sp. SceaMP-e96]|nr:hypothetical protein YWIDRAFT_03686 [Streptomyces sp. SceaMP-e96]